MHILFLSDNFPPETNAPASRTYEHCREWVKSGTKVTVITCCPNFPQGKVYAGYRNALYTKEEMGGIRVIRVWSFIAPNQGFAQRVLDYLSYMVMATLAAIFVRRVDLVVGTSPQFFTVCAAYVVSRLKRRPFVFELRDLWPASIEAVGAIKGSFLINRLQKLELFLYRKAERVVTVTESFKRILVQRGIDSNKIHVITNGVDKTRFYPLSPESSLIEHYELNGKFVAGYIGTHGMAHGLETVLEAAQYMTRLGLDKKFLFLFLGDGANKASLMQKAQAMGLRNVIFINAVSKEEVVKYWALLDACIVHLSKSPVFTTVIPSKIFESMAMGVPLLYGVEGESAEIVETNGAGLTFEPENAQALCNVLMRLEADSELQAEIKANCLRAAGNYDRVELADRMLGVLRAAAFKEAEQSTWTAENREDTRP